MRKWHKLAALCCALFAVLGALCCLAESFVERRRAEELLHVLANVQIGSAQTLALKEKLEGFNRYRSANGSSDGCSYEQFMFRNYGFALFHLAPAKDIWIQINYENGDVVAKAAHFAEAPNRGAFVMEEAGIGCPPASNDSPAPAGRKIYERGTFSEPNYMLSVRDNTSVPESRRRMDWTIDLTCMTRLGPCGDFRKILRGAFE
jgi:hypothetical protein